jgi:hypothetical protein
MRCNKKLPTQNLWKLRVLYWQGWVINVLQGILLQHIRYLFHCPCQCCKHPSNSFFRTVNACSVTTCSIVRFMVFTAVKIWIVIFIVTIPCSLVGGCQCFGGTYCLYIQVYSDDGRDKFLQNNGNTRIHCVNCLHITKYFAFQEFFKFREHKIVTWSHTWWIRRLSHLWNTAFS